MINRADAEVEILWKGKHDAYKSKFITRDSWNLIRTQAVQVEWQKHLWFRHATPEFSFCAWLTVLNHLKTGERMDDWNVGIDGNCVLCKQHLETGYISSLPTLTLQTYGTNWHTICVLTISPLSGMGL